MIAVLAGCGGGASNNNLQPIGSGAGAASSPSSTTGSVAVTTRFAASKDAPANSTSIRVSITLNGQLVVSAGLTNPTIFPRSTGVTQTNTVSGVPAGTYVVLVETLDASGVVNGVVSQPATVQVGQVSAVNATSVQTVTSLAVTPSTAAVSAGAKTTLAAVATLSDNSTAVVTTSATFSSSSASVASVSNAAGTQGVVTGVAAGSAAITATYAGLSGTAMVTVGGPSPSPSPSPAVSPSPAPSPSPSASPSPSPSASPSPTPSPSTVNVTNTNLNNFTLRISGATFNDAAFDPATGTTVLVGGAATVATADANNVVTLRVSGLASATSLNSVAWLGGNVKRFVAVGDTGKIIRSPDGVTWTPAGTNPAPNGTSLTSIVAYTNGTASGYVAVGTASGGKGWILHSSDGDVWTDISVAAANFSYTGIAYGANFGTAPGVPMFEIVGPTQAGSALFQQPAANAAPTQAGWAQATGVTHANMSAVAFAQSGTTGFFVQSGLSGWVDINNAAVNTTLPGDKWSAASAPQITATPGIQAIAYGKVGGQDTLSFVGVSDGVNAQIYVDNTYTAVNANHTYTIGSASLGARAYTQDLFSVRFLNNRFLATGDGNAVANSTNGSAYTVTNYHAVPGVTGAAVGTVNGRPLYVLVGGIDMFAAVANTALIETSTDGITWTQVADSKVSADLGAVCFGNGKFVAIASSGAVTTSTDGVTWTAATTPPGSHSYRAITAGLLGATGKFVAVGNSWVATSSDGLVWTETAVGPSFMNCVSYGKLGTPASDIFVAGANNGVTAWSSDLVTWNTVAAVQTDNLLGMTFAGNKFVAVGASGRIESSTDGKTFVNVGTFGTNLRSVAYVSSPSGAGMFTGFIAVGDTGNIRTSTDGITWSVANANVPQSLAAICVATTVQTTFNALTNVTTNTFTSLFVAGGNRNLVQTTQ